MNTTFKFIVVVAMLMASGIACAQHGSFFLQDRNKGFETKDGKGYVEIEIRDSANIDSYISAIYATLAENYPEARIQTVGNRVLRMEATSEENIWISTEPYITQLLIDFSIMVEVREHPDEIYYTSDTKRPINDYHHVRIYAPVVNKCTSYCPSNKPEVKVYVTKKKEMHDLLMEKENYTKVFGTFAQQFVDKEIDKYIVSNIRAELNQNYYKAQGYEILANKNKRNK